MPELKNKKRPSKEKKNKIFDYYFFKKTIGIFFP
jgi:hypothetical protein